MRHFTSHFILIVSIVCFLLATGCVRREEKIQIFDDGHVDWTIEMKGDESDIKKGDAIPDQSSGWKISEKVEKHDDKDEFIRTAFKSFTSVEDLPESFASDLESQKTSLRFSTSLKKEKTPEGTYYHFKRVYGEETMPR